MLTQCVTTALLHLAYYYNEKNTEMGWHCRWFARRAVHTVGGGAPLDAGVYHSADGGPHRGADCNW